jgi:hypothetical protein
MAIQRDAILGTLAILRTFVAYLRVAAKLEWRLDRPGPINNRVILAAKLNDASYASLDSA